MKLIDILVQELPKHGGWIKGHYQCAQDRSGEVCFYTQGKIHLGKFGIWTIPGDSEATHDGLYRVVTSLADDYEVTIITREQYEAALAASKQDWDGDGLPPVGVNAEVLFYADTEPKWFSFLAKFIGENHVIALVGLEEISYKKDELLTSDVKFAPLRSEEDRKRDEITQSILDILNDYDFDLVHIRSDQRRIAIDLVERITSGMIPHIRID